VHPGKFEMGGIGEAVVTGVGAFVLSLAASAGVRALVRRRARQTDHDQSDPLVSPAEPRETLLDPRHAVRTAAGRDRARDLE
jgi:hypothetical protein